MGIVFSVWEMCNRYLSWIDVARTKHSVSAVKNMHKKGQLSLNTDYQKQLLKQLSLQQILSLIVKPATPKITWHAPYLNNNSKDVMEWILSYSDPSIILQILNKIQEQQRITEKFLELEFYCNPQKAIQKNPQQFITFVKKQLAMDFMLVHF